MLRHCGIASASSRSRDLGNPVYATLLALFFQWGVALHDLEVERIEAGEIGWADKRDILQAIWRNRRQVLKDYVLFPALAGPGAPLVLAGNLTANLTRNVWSLLTGGRLFHILSGNLSHQIEHHLFPDLPARRYPQIAPEVKALCEKYGLPYNTGGFTKQLGSVYGKIARMALPFGRKNAPEPAVRIVPDAQTAAA